MVLSPLRFEKNIDLAVSKSPGHFQSSLADDGRQSDDIVINVYLDASDIDAVDAAWDEAEDGSISGVVIETTLLSVVTDTIEMHSTLDDLARVRAILTDALRRVDEASVDLRLEMSREEA